MLIVCLIPTLVLAQNNDPDVEIKVNKEQDDDGNIISYDSSYSITYHWGDETGTVDVDSLFDSFGFKMNMHALRSMNSDSLLNQLFNQDMFQGESFFYDNFDGQSLKEMMDEMRMRQQELFDMQQDLMQDFFDNPDSAPQNENQQPQQTPAPKSPQKSPSPDKVIDI